MFNLRSKVFTGTETGASKIRECYASDYISENESICACNNENLLTNVVYRFIQISL